MNILVLGHSGTGKTSSINAPSSYDPEAKDYGYRLDPKETLMLVTHKKDLPFRGFKKTWRDFINCKKIFKKTIHKCKSKNWSKW